MFNSQGWFAMLEEYRANEQSIANEFGKGRLKEAASTRKEQDALHPAQQVAIASRPGIAACLAMVKEIQRKQGK